MKKKYIIIFFKKKKKYDLIEYNIFILLNDNLNLPEKKKGIKSIIVKAVFSYIVAISVWISVLWIGTFL